MKKALQHGSPRPFAAIRRGLGRLFQRLLDQRTVSRVLKFLVRFAAALTCFVLVFLVGYILFKGVPHLSPSLFAWEYTSENVSLMPALINTLLMILLALAVSLPLGIGAAIYLTEYTGRGNKLVSLIRITAETLSGIPSIVYGLFGMLFFVTALKLKLSLISGALTCPSWCCPPFCAPPRKPYWRCRKATGKAALAWARAGCAPCGRSYCLRPCRVSLPG